MLLACNCTATTCVVSVSSGLPPSSLHYAELSLPHARPFALITTTNFPLMVEGLQPSTNYVVDIRSLVPGAPSIAWGPSWGKPSPSVACTTRPAPPAPRVPTPSAAAVVPGVGTTSRWLRVFRVSEYSFDVDFLANHDAASVDAMPLYLMTCDPEGNCAPWSVADPTPRWEGCQAALSELLPGQRGGGFACVSAAVAARVAVEAACGPFSDQDTLKGEGSFSVHWHCGVGWPESTAEEGPITEYCIEYTPVPDPGEGGEGFAFYLSCNSDEVDAYGNDPKDPSCICMCLDDRMLAHQNLTKLALDCQFNSPAMPWVNETVCNCPGTSSEVPGPSHPSRRYVGRAPVYLPYVGQELTPREQYDASILGGYNFHFPKEGKCAEGEPLGTDGCTWRREPLARMLYGADLLASGWNRTFVPDTPTDQTHTRANVAAFARAVGALDALIQPVACRGVVGV